MGDLLERYIVDHRQEFDDLEPSDKLWKGIEDGVKSKKRDWSVLWKVAAMIFLASTIFLTIERQFIGNDNIELSESKREFFEVERYYFQLISDTKNELEGLNIREKNADLIQEEYQLDKIYQNLKEEYLNQNSSEILKDALVENLRLRIKILSNQVKILNEIDQENHDDSNITI